MPKLKVHDVDLYYESTGRGQPLLFIHGLGSSLRDWERQVPFFSINHQVITLDVRGHKRSYKPLARITSEDNESVASLTENIYTHTTLAVKD